MSDIVKEHALEFYPTLWPLSWLKSLVAAGKLSAEEYKAITGEAYAA